MKSINLNYWKNICLATGLVVAGACTPEEYIPGVKMMDISVSQSYVNPDIKAQWEVGDSVSVFFDGIKTPKYFTVTSVSADKETATIRGDYPYGVANGTQITAVYPYTAISADVSALPVDLTELMYKDGAVDMSSMIYSASAIYQNDQITTLGFTAQTAKVTLDIEPFDGFDPAQLNRVDIKSTTLTTSASLNLLAGEDEDPWRLRVSNGLSVTLREPVVAASRTENGGVKIDLICIPTEEGKVVDKLNVFLTAGDKMFYAEVTEGFEIKQNLHTNSQKTNMLNEQESGAMIFWRKLEEKQMNSGVIRDADGVFRAYYDINYNDKKVSFIELSKEQYEKYNPVTVSEQTLTPGYYTLDWETPVCGVKGMKYDAGTDAITLNMAEGSELASIDGNTDAAEEFLAGNGVHYEIKLNRNDVQPSYTRGAMSKALWNGAMSQGFMNVIELNSGNGWSFVTYPNNYTSYLSKYTTLSKDRIKAEWTGQFYPGFVADKDLNEKTIRENILNNYYAENLFIPAMPGSHIFFVINPETKEWFKFQPQNEDDLSIVEGSAIEKRILLGKYDAGVFRKNGEFMVYYDMDLNAETINFYSLNNGDIEFKEGIKITKADRTITWAEPVQGVTGIELNDKNNLVLMGETSLSLDNNPTAATEFLDKNAGHHYTIVIDRNSGKCSRGNMSSKFLDMVKQHPTMTSIEINKDWNWDMVVFPSGPNGYAFYKTAYETVAKDEIKFTNNGYDGGYSDSEDTKKIIQGMLDCFYDTNIVVRQKTGGLKPFYVINKAGKGWFLFERD